jgi:hypothetical protein
MKFGAGGVAMRNFQTREILVFLTVAEMDDFQSRPHLH